MNCKPLCIFTLSLVVTCSSGPFCALIIIIIIIIIVSFMQDIYTYIPETNYVSRQHIVATILLLLYMELNIVSFSVESIVFLH